MSLFSGPIANPLRRLVAAGAVFCASAAEFRLQPVVSPEAPLDDSLQEEVDHACALAEAWLEAQPADTNAVPAALDLFRTNGLTRRAVAVRLVAAQRAGHWVSPVATNAPWAADVPVTRLAHGILSDL